jgi:hypothetical protein
MIKTLFCCNGGEIIAWSRILDDEKILCIVNSNGTDKRGGDVIVDSNIMPKIQIFI